MYLPRDSSPVAYQPRKNGSGSSGIPRPSWSPKSSSVKYTTNEIRELTPVRRIIEERFASYPDLRDIFLCHAWDDRQDAAMMLHDLLEASGVSVWFSEKDIRLGVPLLRAIDKGLANSRAGIVPVTPAFLDRVKKEGWQKKNFRSFSTRVTYSCYA